jgi:MoxR-like ATPase
MARPLGTGDDTPRGRILALRERMGEAIIGQRAVIDRLPIGLLANGNLLVEGLPGLAMTGAIKSRAKNLECDRVPALRFRFFRRIGEKGVGP